MVRVIRAKAKWIDNLKFVASANSNHAIVMDARKEEGGEDSAPRPMELALISYAGCTAMDVAAILKRLKVEFEDFWVEIEGTRAKKHPRIFKKVKLVYTLKGKNIDERKFRRAVELSQDLFCSVTPMFKAVAEIEYELKIIDTGKTP